MVVLVQLDRIQDMIPGIIWPSMPWINGATLSLSWDLSGASCINLSAMLCIFAIQGIKNHIKRERSMQFYFILLMGCLKCLAINLVVMPTNTSLQEIAVYRKSSPSLLLYLRLMHQTRHQSSWAVSQLLVVASLAMVICLLYCVSYTIAYTLDLPIPVGNHHSKTAGVALSGLNGLSKC